MTAALRWDDLSGERQRIGSSVSVVRHGTNQDRKKVDLIDDVTKTANHRAVTVDEVTVALWDAYRDSFADEGDWVFGRFEPANPDRISWWWRRAWELSGVTTTWWLRNLRHWSATEAIAGGHDVRIGAGRSGHDNAAKDAGVNAHVLERADRGGRRRPGPHARRPSR